MNRIFLSLVLCLCAGAAQAELTLCNKGEAAQTVGLAYKKADAWFSEGWWTIESADCKLLVGGDLANRYYYYTVKNPSGFAGEGFSFCAKDESYELTGVDGDCGAIGSNSRSYAQIDTGETSKSFSFDLPAVAAPKADGAAPKADGAAPKQDAAPAPVSALVLPSEATTDYFTQGQQGEPFTIFGRVQNCTNADGFDGCFVYADGWRWAFANGGGSNPAVMAALATMPVNTPVAITGDVLNYGDITVDAIASKIELAPPDANDATLTAMQGSWISVDDPQAKLVIYGSEQTDFYGSETVATSVISFVSACPDGSGGEGTKLLVTQMGMTPEDALCYAVEEASATTLTLIYIPRGNFLTYTRD